MTTANSESKSLEKKGWGRKKEKKSCRANVISTMIPERTSPGSITVPKLVTKTTDTTKKLRHGDPDRTDRRTYSAVPWHNTAYTARNIGLPGVRGRTLQREVYPGTPPGLPVFFALRRCNTRTYNIGIGGGVEGRGTRRGRKEGRGGVREKEEEKGK